MKGVGTSVAPGQKERKLANIQEAGVPLTPPSKSRVKISDWWNSNSHPERYLQWNLGNTVLTLQLCCSEGNPEGWSRR